MAKTRKLTPAQKHARQRARNLEKGWSRFKGGRPETKIWISEITGRQYSSEARMRAAERAHYKQAELYIVRRGEQTLPRSWETIAGFYRSLPHNNPDGIMHRIFYDIQSGDWTEIKEYSLYRYYVSFGLYTLDSNGVTLYDFIRYGLGVDDI